MPEKKEEEKGEEEGKKEDEGEEGEVEEEEEKKKERTRCGSRGSRQNQDSGEDYTLPDTWTSSGSFSHPILGPALD